MSQHPADAHEPVPASVARRASRGRRLLWWGGGLVLLWAAVAYLVLPALWTRYAETHPSLEDIPGITYTGTGVSRRSGSCSPARRTTATRGATIPSSTRAVRSGSTRGWAC